MISKWLIIPYYRFFLWIAIFWIAPTTLTHANTVQAAQTLGFDVFPDSNPILTKQRFNPPLRYIEERMGITIELIISTRYEDLPYQFQENEIRIVWKTPAYTNYVWAIQPGFNETLRDRLLDCFLSLSLQNNDQRNILEALGASSFLPSNNEDFEALREAAKS